MTRTSQPIVASAIAILLLVAAFATRGGVNTRTGSAVDARTAALIEGNRYVQQLEARVNAFDAKEAALIEGNRYVQQLEAQIKAYREAQR